MESGFPILSLILFLPIAGTVLMLLIPKDNKSYIKGIATGTTILIFLVSLLLLPWFDYQQKSMQYLEKVKWIPTLNLNYTLGIDGISLLLVLMTTFLMVIAVLSSYSAIAEREKEYYIFLLILETGILGVFISLDFVLFYFFWEAMLIPMYFLIGIWGDKKRIYAATKFFLYTLVGSLLMLVGFIALAVQYYNQVGTITFDLITLAKTTYPLNFQVWVFLSFFVAFAIKVPLFPFHTWLPDAHVEAPTAVSLLLAGVLLKMGVYGFIRIANPILPEAAVKFAPWIVILSIIGIIYGALLALAQKNLKRLVAYSSISHLGFIMLGLFALNTQGVSGSVIQMVNHGLITGALFLSVGILTERTHSKDISYYGGLSSQVPIFTAYFGLFMLASLGLPGLNGFVGEFLILVGAFLSNRIYGVVAALGIILAAGYLLWMFQRVMYGQIKNKKLEKVKDLNNREIIYLTPIVLLIIWIGVYPLPLFNILAKSVEVFLDKLV